MAVVISFEHDVGDADEANRRRAAYLVAGRRLEARSRGFAEAIATAYERHEQPRCLCVPKGVQMGGMQMGGVQMEGVEMYIARLGDGYIVKRMPDTGSRHAPDCPSYEPPADASGLGQVLGTAIAEDPATGETTLKLDFSLSKIAGRSTMPSPGAESDSASSSGTKLTLRGLLHYLWDQAELTRWHPGFAGKRNWAMVRSHLLRAAQHKTARGDALGARLYVPEVFSVDERDAINTRRLAKWQQAIAAPAKPQRLMLLIGEVKEIVPARYGFKAVVKHLPDQAFAIDEQLYRRLGRRFESELALWSAADDIHMVIIATFGISAAGLPAIVELCLMPVTRQWLPVEDAFDKQLVERLVTEERSFVKALRYNLRSSDFLACATLTDCEPPAPLLFIDRGDDAEGAGHGKVDCQSRERWVWRPIAAIQPRLPVTRATHRTARWKQAGSQGSSPIGPSDPAAARAPDPAR